MPNGAKFISSGQVIVKRVDRRHAGKYQCIANTTEGVQEKNMAVNVLCKCTTF